MGALHLLNCLALGLGPLGILWKGGMEEAMLEVVGVCVGVYCVTQLVQIVMLATFVEGEGAEWEWVCEGVVKGIDVVGLVVLMEQKSVKEKGSLMQVRIAGLTWCLGGAAARMPALFKAAAPHFTLAPLHAAIALNLDMLIEHAFATATLALPSPLSFVLILFRCFTPAVYTAFSFLPNEALLAHATIAVFLAVCAYALRPHGAKRD